MGTLCNGRDNVPTNLIPPRKVSSAKNEIRVVELLAKGAHLTPQTSRLLSTLLVALCSLMVRPHRWRQHLCHWTRRSWASVQQAAAPPMTSIHDAGRCSAPEEKSPIIPPPQTLQPTTSTCRPAFRIHWFNCGTNVRGITKPFFFYFNAHSMSWNPFLILLKWPRTRDYVGHGPGRKHTNIILLKEYSNDSRWCIVIPMNQHKAQPSSGQLLAIDGN